jgi:uncharacterized membrane protein (UPF0182 family)
VSFERDPRGPRPVLARRRRGALAPTLIIIGVLIVLGLIASQIWTDVLWYQSVGYTQVFRKELITKILLFIIGGVLMGAAVASSLLIGYRSRPIYAPVSAEQAGLDRYRESIEPLRKLVGIAVPIVVALFAGSAASGQWQTVLLWLNRVSFGQKDPQFHLDIGFFVFTLPWLQFVLGFLTAVVLVAGIAALVTHYLYGGLRLQGGGQRFTSAARVHLCVLAAVFLILRGIGYWVGRYSLSTKDSKLITGLDYTDAKAVLTAKGVLAGIALIVAILFVITAVVDRWRLIPLYGVALLVVSAIVVGGIYPAVVQRFQVTPSAKELEAPYIQRNIAATRAAYGLQNVQVTPYSAATTASKTALAKDAASLPGIRLLDPSLVSPTFAQLQQIKQYYSFPDSLDVDRYTIDGQVRDTVIAARELNIASAPTSQRNWVNDHIVYTHGYGVVAAYGNQTTAAGEPDFFEQKIPSVGDLGTYQPRIYYGENSPDYSIVGAPAGAQPQELDYPDSSATGQENNTYQGTGGVKIGSTFRKLLYAIKFRQQNILLSKQVNSDSRLLYDRNPKQMVEKVAPFLTLDGDPYPAVIDGKTEWIIDGYTTSNRYPYSRTQVLKDATSDSITANTTAVTPLDNEKVNYIRNSVKATVDAYNGTVTLYTWDNSDPVLKAWKKIFPTAVKPMSDIDSELMQHVRYPEDLFKIQRELEAQYHVSDPGAFFGQQDFWEVPDDPTRSGNLLQPPYYLSLQMPGTSAAQFSLTSTFIPAGRSRSVLTGFMAVDSDAGSTAGQPASSYGQVRLLQLPRDTVIPGPGQVQNTFNSDSNVSQVLNLLARSGSDTSIERGNLLTLPLAGGLLYVQPVYVRSASTSTTTYPILQKVLVAFGSQIGFADDLNDALDQVFGNDSGGTTTTPPVTGTGTATGANAEVQQDLQDALAAMKDADAALKAGDFAAYGAAQKRVTTAIQAAVDAEAAAQAKAKTSATPTAKPSASVTAGATTTPSAAATTPTPTATK